MIYSVFISIWFTLSILTFITWITVVNDNKFVHDQLFVFKYGKLLHKILMFCITCIFIPFTIPSLIKKIRKQNKK